jgi:hypothetical protein
MMTRFERSMPIPSVWKCAALLMAIRLALKMVGFGRSISLIRARTVSFPRTRRADLKNLEAIARNVARAAALLPGRILCLEQAATLFLLVRRRGIDVHFRVGVQPYGFVAHAWVEFEGKAIFEPGETIRRLVPLPDIIS